MSGTQQDFIATFGPLANDVAAQTGLKAEVVLGQIAQETGYGSHVSGNGTNPFGISPNGRPAVYPSIQDGARAYIALIKSRYSDAATHPDANGQAAAISRGGYGPDQTYGASVAARARTVQQAGYNAPTDADIRTMMDSAATGSTGQAKSAVSAPSDADIRTMLDSTPTAPEPPPQAAAKSDATAEPPEAPHGIAKNIAAGTLEAAGKVGDIAANPVSELLGNPLAIGIVTAHDALAPVFGYKRFPDDVRNLLLGRDAASNVPGPGTLAIQKIGKAIGANPEDVPATTTADQLVRSATTNALLGAAAGPAVAVGGGAGAVAGHYAEQAVPPWMAPAAGLTANLLAGGAAAGVAKGGLAVAGGVKNLASNHVATDFVPPGPPPAAPEPSYVSGVNPPVAENLLSGKAPAVDPAAVAAANRAAEIVAKATGKPPPESPIPEMHVYSRGETSPNPNLAGNSTVGAAQNPNPGPAATPAERAAWEMKTLNQSPSDRAGPSGVDPTVYVEGYRPTLAEVSGNGRVSVEEKALRSLHPEQFVQRDTENFNALKDKFSTLSEDPIRLQQLEDIRTRQGDLERNAAFANKSSVDASPILAEIDKMLAAGASKRGFVAENLNNVRKTLFDKADNLETDPEILAAARDNVKDLLSKAAMQEKPTTAFAEKQLTQVKNTFDSVIEKGAPGYQAYLKNYAANSRPIEAMELLQKATVGPSKITNDKGEMLLRPYQRLMDTIVRQRALDGVNPAKSIPEDTMNELWAIRNELARRSNIDLGKPRGSDTNQMKERTKTMGISAFEAGSRLGAHVLGNYLAGPIGSVFAEGVFAKAKAKIAKMQDKEVQKLISKHLSSHDQFEGPSY